MNLQSTFSVLGFLYPPTEVPREATPLYLPDKYTPYPFKTSRSFPMPLLPRDNPLLTKRVELGKYLFHDKSLSANGTVSAQVATIRLGHLPMVYLYPLASKGKQEIEIQCLFSILPGNLLFSGMVAPKSLRDQVLQPIEDHNEMASELSTVIEHLKKNQQHNFERAFGPGSVNEEKIALALKTFSLL